MRTEKPPRLVRVAGIGSVAAYAHRATTEARTSGRELRESSVDRNGRRATTPGKPLLN